MLSSYEELAIDFEFLGAVEVSIKFQTDYKKVIKKIPNQPYSVQYLGIKE